MTLGVKIDDQDALMLDLRKVISQVNDGGGLAYSTFLVGYGDDFEAARVFDPCGYLSM
jgi:hypothetical protein